MVVVTVYGQMFSKSVCHSTGFLTGVKQSKSEKPNKKDQEPPKNGQKKIELKHIKEKLMSLIKKKIQKGKVNLGESEERDWGGVCPKVNFQ